LEDHIDFGFVLLIQHHPCGVFVVTFHRLLGRWKSAMMDNRLKVEIAQLQLSNLGRGYHASCKSPDL
jgi:hypothetical protein